MTFLRFFVLAIGLMVAACTTSAATGPWDGEYQFAGLGGETGGGSPIMMDITLTIKKSGSDGYCFLYADGFQTTDRIVCSLTDNGNKLEVKFKSYEDGKILNGHNVAVYKVGEILFVLEKKEGKDKKIRYIPHWASYVPFDDMKIGGKYVFTKTK